MPYLGELQNPKTIGQHIRKRRIELGILQVDAAKLLGVCEDTMTRWENDINEPDIANYPTIIRFLGYNPVISDTSTLGGRMKKYRIEKGLSQQDLANLVGVDESTIFHWEKNVHKPMPGKLKLLENIFDIKELSL